MNFDKINNTKMANHQTVCHLSLKIIKLIEAFVAH